MLTKNNKITMNTEELIGSTDSVLMVRDNVRNLGHGVLAMPEDFDIRSVEEFLPSPSRARRKVQLLTMADLLEFVPEEQRRRTFEPVWFVNSEEMRCVLNYNHNDAAERALHGWGDSYAAFSLRHTREWEEWEGHSGKAMGQEDFCDFIEDNMECIEEPSGADVLEMVRDFRMLTKVEYGSSFRSRDGQIGLTYKESDGGATQDMTLPEVIKLRLAVIKGAEEDTTYFVKARLRTRIDKETHKLSLRYELVRPDVPKDNALRDIAAIVRGRFPEARVYCGVLSR